MRKICGVLCLALLCGLLSGCGATAGGPESGAPSLSGRVSTAPRGDVDAATGLPEDAGAGGPVALLIEAPVTADQATLRYTIENKGAEPVLVVLIPSLELLDGDIWTEQTFSDDVGFCGTPDSVDAGGTRSGEVDLAWYGGPLPPGTYKLSYDVVSEDGYEKLYAVSATFTVEDDAAGTSTESSKTQS